MCSIKAVLLRSARADDFLEARTPAGDSFTRLIDIPAA
jgi:hypothetical protein